MFGDPQSYATLDEVHASNDDKVFRDLASVDPAAIRRRVGSRRLYLRVKRAIDVLLVLLAVPAVTPVVLIAMLVIRLRCGSPIFFRQRRIGLGGRPFEVVKLRTMRVGGAAPCCATAVGDVRITPIGVFLRKSHIDELPQLWNVLRGEMSLIGPRPEQVALVAKYREAIPNYDLRHLVPPGLSGWSQVYYGYALDAADTRAKLEHDLYYLERFGPTVDLVVFLRTLVLYLLPVDGR